MGFLIVISYSYHNKLYSIVLNGLQLFFLFILEIHYNNKNYSFHWYHNIFWAFMMIPAFGQT